MSFDGLSVNGVVKELADTFTGSKIQRIYQPYKDEIILYFSDKRKEGLLLCANASFPRVHITKETYDNPEYPPAFCMLLRKYLIGGIIKKVYQNGFDRVINISVEALDEANNLICLCLSAEIMGKHSNLILYDIEKGIIVDSIKHISYQKSTVRVVMPNHKYNSPPNTKLDPFEFDVGDALNVISFYSDKPIVEALPSLFSGISKQLSESFVYNYSYTQKKVCDCTTEEISEIISQFIGFLTSLKKENYGYVYLLEDGRYKDFSYGKYNIYDGLNSVRYTSISAAIEEYYKDRTQHAGIKEKYEVIIKQLENLLSKEQKKLALRIKERKEALDSTQYSIKGNLLLSNLYLLKKGMKRIELDNYYDNGNKITINLRADYTPSQNSQMYFKKYAKAKSAVLHLDKLINENESDVEELNTLIYFLTEAANASEAEQVINQAQKEGYLKAPKQKKHVTKTVCEPHMFITDDGYEIYAGKNSLQNASLTFSSANKDDIWLHAKDVAASHVILKTHNRTYTNEALNCAALVAAYYSKSRTSDKVQIDYTLVKNVKKISGAAPGRVTYTNYKSIFIKPSENAIRQLDKKGKNNG